MGRSSSASIRQIGCCLFGFISVLPPCTTASCPHSATEEAVSWLRARLKDGWTSRDFNYGRNPVPVWAARCKLITSPSRGIFFASSYCKHQPFLYVLRIIFDFPKRSRPYAPPGFPFFLKTLVLRFSQALFSFSSFSD